MRVEPNAFLRVPAGPVIAIAAVAALWTLSGTSGSVDRVPGLVGLRADVAGTLAAERGFLTEIELRPAGGVAGTVIDQRPRPDAFLERGSIVTVGVSRGAVRVKVPDVTSMPVDEARRALEEAGLAAGDVRYRTSAEAEGGRVASTEPKAGTEVDAGTKVEITSVLE
jgi:serine/threonine-protein kinase